MSLSSLRALMVLAWVIVAGVLVQAVLAGQSLYQGAGLFTLHGWIGQGVFVISIVVGAATWFAHLPRRVAVLASVNVARVGRPDRPRVCRPSRWRRGGVVAAHPARRCGVRTDGCRGDAADDPSLARGTRGDVGVATNLRGSSPAGR